MPVYFSYYKPIYIGKNMKNLPVANLVLWLCDWKIWKLLLPILKFNHKLTKKKMIQYQILSVSSFLMIYKTTKYIMILINFYLFYFRVKRLINLYTVFFSCSFRCIFIDKNNKKFSSPLIYCKKIIKHYEPNVNR